MMHERMTSSWAENMDTIAARIGESTSKFGNILGVSRHALIKWSRGVHPRLHFAAQVSRRTGYTMHALAGLESLPDTPNCVVEPEAVRGATSWSETIAGLVDVPSIRGQAKIIAERTGLPEPNVRTWMRTAIEPLLPSAIIVCREFEIHLDVAAGEVVRRMPSPQLYRQTLRSQGLQWYARGCPGRCDDGGSGDYAPPGPEDDNIPF